MNDYIFKIMMQHRHEEISADFRAARISQQEWHRIIFRLRHRLSSFYYQVKKFLKKTRYLKVSEKKCI